MPRISRTQGFPRLHRFTAQGAFGAVLRGPRKIRGRFTTVHAVAARAGVSRLGVGLTRKLVPRAVDRNCVKRLVREIFRRHMLKRAGLDCVVMLRERFERAHMAALREEVRAHFDQLVPNAST